MGCWRLRLAPWAMGHEHVDALRTFKFSLSFGEHCFMIDSRRLVLDELPHMLLVCLLMEVLASLIAQPSE